MQLTVVVLWEAEIGGWQFGAQPELSKTLFQNRKKIKRAGGIPQSKDPRFTP